MSEERAALLADLTRAREELLVPVAGLDAATAARRPTPDEWSVVENLLHVADLELVTIEHLGRILASDDPPLSGSRGAEFAAERAEAAALGLPGAVARLATVRAALLVICGALDGRHLARAGQHPKFGQRTIAGWLQQRAKHERDHHAQIEQTIRAISRQASIDDLIADG
jgi:hypothetical protein